MPDLTVTTNIELDPWTDLGPPMAALREGRLERIGLLPDGTEGGRAVVAMVVVLPDGEHVFVQTTLRIFRATAAALLAAPVAELDEP